MRKELLAVVVVLVLFFAICIPTLVEADEICACVGPTGRNRFVDVTQNCRSFESKECWNIGIYSNTAIVALSGGDYDDPVAAMADYAEWCGEPSAANTCLLKIMPGTYDIDSNSVVMQEYIDIEGSGENVTKIVGDTDAAGMTGVVQGASNAEIRFLSVENAGGGSNAVAISYDDESPRILHVTAKASGGSGNNCGVHVDHPGVSPLSMTNLTAIASGGINSYAIWYIDCTPALKNVAATASGGSIESYGVFDNNDTGGASTIEHSVISGTTGSIKSQGFGSAKIAGTKLDGNVVNVSADPAPKCAGVWDGSFNFYPDCCPGLCPP